MEMRRWGWSRVNLVVSAAALLGVVFGLGQLRRQQPQAVECRGCNYQPPPVRDVCRYEAAVAPEAQPTKSYDGIHLAGKILTTVVGAMFGAMLGEISGASLLWVVRLVIVFVVVIGLSIVMTYLPLEKGQRGRLSRAWRWLRGAKRGPDEGERPDEMGRARKGGTS